MTYKRGFEKVPKPWGSKDPEWLSFLNYVKQHFRDAIDLTNEIVPNQKDSPSLWRQVFDKVTSHLAYLWEEWQLMTSEKRLPYATSKYKSILKQQMQKVEETTKKAEEMGLGKS